ncbi:endonuclease domain-containing protein [Candidatus Parcubacteria bacterium]|nr:endonuclease domain-containing protein [Candidatus Parcubacteria bacterium]
MNGVIKINKKFIPYNKSLTEKARENRKNPTKAEKKIWYEILQDKEFDRYKFIRQKPLDNFIVDYYCSELLFAIEIDGDSHAQQINYDISRTEKLNKLGIKIVRYTNFEILDNIAGVYDDLKIKVGERKKELVF